MKAIRNRIITATSNQTLVVASNHGLPANSTRSECFERTGTPTPCPWKDRRMVTISGRRGYERA